MALLGGVFPHRSRRSGTIRRCVLVDRSGLVGGSVSLGMGFEVSNAQARPSVSLSLFLLPEDLDVELSASYLSSTMSATLPPCFLLL